MTHVIDYDNRTFVSLSNSPNGDVGAATVFRYHQQGSVVWATYSGGDIEFGTLIAVADSGGILDMRYHHVNVRGEIATGVCRSVPEVLADGRLRLHERWRWTSGDCSEGESVVEECREDGGL